MSDSLPGDPPERVEGPSSLISQGLAFAETEAGKRALSRAAAKALAAEDLAGETLAERYRLIRQIGRGGMGAVYLAEHTLIGKTVAVKVLGYEHSKRSQDIERFLFEARAASKIRHEHIVDITDFGYTDDGLAFLVMEHLEGEDLAATCKREGRLPWPRVLAIAEQICAALGAAHDGGIVHRDMKLENCFRISRGGNDDYIKVLDFGIAKILDDAQEQSEEAMTSSALVGTPEYVAPELVRGLKADARADIYAVGVAMYKLLTGDVPLRGESYMATLTKHLLEKPLPPRRRVPSVGIPEAIDEVVMRALEKDPDRRYQTVVEMGAVISLLRDDGEVEPGRRRLWLALGTLALVVLTLLLILISGRCGPEVDDTQSVALASKQTTSTSTTGSSSGTSTGPESESGPEPTTSTTSTSTTGTTGEVAPQEPIVTPPPQLATKLSAREISRGLNGVRSRIKRCSNKYALPGMKVKVRLKIAGASGRPISAQAQGSHRGSSLGKCIEHAIRKATFPKKSSDTSVTRNFKM